MFIVSRKHVFIIFNLLMRPIICLVTLGKCFVATNVSWLEGYVVIKELHVKSQITKERTDISL